MKKEAIIKEQKELVLARFQTLNPNAKIMLGNSNEITVKELMNHIKKGDEFGKKIIKTQMKMLKVLATGV